MKEAGIKQLWERKSQRRKHLRASGPGATAWSSQTSSHGRKSKAWATEVLGPVFQPLPSAGSFTPAEESQVSKPPPESPAPPSRPLPPQSLEGLQPAGPETGGLERAPIQNSPWKETSLDHPYEKPRKSSEPNSESRSGMGRKLGWGGGKGYEQGKAWETAPLLNCDGGRCEFWGPLPLCPLPLHNSSPSMEPFLPLTCL